MKKQIKLITIVLVIMIALLSISNVVLAANSTVDLSGKIDEIAKGDSSVTTDKLTNIGQTIVTIMQVVGIVVAVVVLLILGIKYMMGSAEEKAEYKKTMIPYLVGAVLIFASTTIVNVVYQLANNLNS